MARGVTVGKVRYPTKEAVRERCREIVQRYGIGGIVTSEEDDQFLRDLLELHPEYDVKRDVGISHFRIVKHQWGAKSAGFLIVRLDSSVIDFSWNSCLTPPSHRTQVLGALRMLIRPQVKQARSEILQAGQPLVCAVTGAAIPSVDELHMDHASPTFLELAEAFIASQGGLDAFEIIPDTGDKVGYTELRDHILRLQWQDYHEEHAVLRPVLKRVNLSNLRRKG